MISIVMVSHGELATGLLQTLGLFYGELEGIEALVLRMSDNPEEFGLRIRDVYDNLGAKDGMLILTDIPGGSPCNQARQFAQEHPDVRIVSGLNLMMALEACMKRSTVDLDTLCDEIIRSACESIQRIGTMSNDFMNDNEVEF